MHTASDVIKAGTRQELQSILDSIWFKSPESPLEFHGFLELPQELRDLVYEFYFEGSFIGSEHQLPLDCCNLPGLLSTSRQLYEESKVSCNVRKPCRKSETNVSNASSHSVRL